MNDDRPSVGEVLAEIRCCLHPLYAMSPDEVVGPDWCPITVAQAIQDLESQEAILVAECAKHGPGYVQRTEDEPDLERHRFEEGSIDE